MKIYVDTNIIFGFFRNLLLEKRKGKKFTETSVLKFIKEGKFELYTSVLVKAEIARRLRTEWGSTKEEVEEFWTSLETYINVDVIQTATIGPKIAVITLETPFKNKVSNIMHLLIAEQYDLWFLSVDKEIVQKGKKFYEKVISYHELRKIS